jgi:hypothetical protein
VSANLEGSAVIRVIADNLPKTQKPGGLGAPAAVGGHHAVVSIASNKVVVAYRPWVESSEGDNERRAACFAAALTAKGWRPLPAMTVLAGKRLYTDAEAAAAVRALFASIPV